MTSRGNPGRARLSVALSLVSAAAALLVAEHSRAARGPVRGAEAQALLAELVTILAPVEQWVPRDEPLRYVRPLDSQGRPIFDENVLALVQAVLAPRRVARELEARTLLVHYFEPEARALVPELARARILADLGGGFALAVEDPP